MEASALLWAKRGGHSLLKHEGKASHEGLAAKMSGVYPLLAFNPLTENSLSLRMHAKVAERPAIRHSPLFRIRVGVWRLLCSCKEWRDGFSRYQANKIGDRTHA